MIVVSCSLQVSHELRFFNNNRSRRHIYNSKQLDALSFRFLGRVNRPLCNLPSRYNSFVCRASISPLRGGEIPILKAAATALSRSYNAFYGNHFVLHLVTGLVIIVFTSWWLAPLTRYARNLIFKRSDSSWKRSDTHYFTTSYLQPLLLWIGATLVCRAFDPVVLSSQASGNVKKRLLVFVRSSSTILAFAYCLSSFIEQAQQVLVETNDCNDTRNVYGFSICWESVYSAVWVAAVSLFMELLGFSTQKMLTAGGLGTVLLTLAGREIFTNFLSSMMIHATQPFVLNEWIQTKIEGYEVSGTVEHVGWWSPTIIRGDDREAIHIPNHKFTMNVVRNLSQKTHWRIKTHFAISHLDVDKINHIVADMRKVLAKNPQVEQQRLHRRVFFERVDPENQALVILVSCFVKTSRIEECFCVKESILLDLLRVISHHQARLATPIRTVQKMQSEEDMENIPFSETIFTRARADTNRPFLLIEPPYKINHDDKVKSQIRYAHTDEEQEAKITSTLTDDSSAATTPDLKPHTPMGEPPFISEADNEVLKMSQNKFDDTTVAKPSNANVDSKTAAPSVDINQSITESVVDKMVEVTSSDPHSADSKVVVSKVNPEVAATPPECAPPNHVSVGLEDEGSKISTVDNVSMARSSSTLSSMPQDKDLDATGVSSRGATLLGPSLKGPQALLFNYGPEEVQRVPSEKTSVSSPRHAMSTLEDNILLGAALEGSKRTLPIEEGVISSPTVEITELAAYGSGGGSSSIPKDKEDDHNLAASGDQRGQER